jgi:hypothetical protein
VRSLRVQACEDYLARLALSNPSRGRPWNQGVTVKPPDGALLDEIRAGVFTRL